MVEKLRKKASELPLLPGVYLMLDKSGAVIYVGKAKQLKNRVGSYFSGTHDAKTEVLVSKIRDFDIIVTNTEFEAFVLENSLVKHHMPKYNILLKDDKGFPFLRIDKNSEYPTIKIVSKPANDKALYLGPFSGRSILSAAVEVVCKALKLPTCGKNISKIVGKERPCLNYHMGACIAYCKDKNLKPAHNEAIDAAKDIFLGKTSALTTRLEQEMNTAAENLQFEIAAEKRDRLRAIENFEKKQFVIAGAMADIDVVGFFRGTAKSCLTVLHYIEGTLISKDYELFDTPFEDDPDAVIGAVRQYYERRGVMPKIIYLPVVSPDSEFLQQLFSEKSNSSVKVLSPQRGDKLKLVETANINAREETERASTQEEKTLKTLSWLQNALGLETMPQRIEGYDISNTGGSDTVASMSVFYKNKPIKRDFRRFIIKSVEGQDDYAAMAEVLSRRIARYLGQNGHTEQTEETMQNDKLESTDQTESKEAGAKKTDSFSILPDIILVDGGVGHVSVAARVMEQSGVAVPVFGMVKDDKHKTRALVTPDGKEIGIIANPAVFALIGTIQEETHNYAVQYHQNLRSKRNIKSKLDNIEGVGQKRRNDLLKKFGSVKGVAAAEIEELTAVVPFGTAESIYKHFRGESGE